MSYPGLPEDPDREWWDPDADGKSGYEVRREYGDILCRYGIYHSNGGFVDFAATLWGAKRLIRKRKATNAAAKLPPVYREAS